MTRNSKWWRISCYNYQDAIIIINFIIIIIIIIIIIYMRFWIIFMIKITEYHAKTISNTAKPDFSLYASDLSLKQLTQIVIHKIVDSFLRPKLFLVSYHISLQVLLVYHVTDNSRVFWI